MKQKTTKIVQSSKLDTLLRKTFERDKMITVKNTKMFLSFLNKLSWRVVILATMTTLKGARNRVKMIHNFGHYLVNLNRKHGPDFVIAYLKASQLAISKYIAREPLGSLMEVNPDYIFPRLASGLPKYIGPRDRISIRHNNRKTIILWMSIFGLFRILQGTYKLKLATIVNPFSGSSAFLAEKSLSMSSLTLNSLRALPWIRKNSEVGCDAISSNRLLLFTTSSPSSKVSWKGALIDVIALHDMGLSGPMLRFMELCNSRIRSHFVHILNVARPLILGQCNVISERIAYVSSEEADHSRAMLMRLRAAGSDSDSPPLRRIAPLSRLHLIKVEAEESFSEGSLVYISGEDENETWVIDFIMKEDVFPIPLRYVAAGHTVHFITKPTTQSEINCATILSNHYEASFKNEAAVGQVGQLQFAKEAAGKLRVFAMVDIWTQSIMQPIHKLLTNILRAIPNDGTSNQTLSYERARQKSILYGKSYGYDLSAATDRLPISIQVSILRGVFRSIGIDTNISVELSLLWKEILVNRPFLVPKLQKGVEDPQELAGSTVYYEVGQPMGALSSFNMLALTHRMILQDIATSLGYRGWFDPYEITGDDIVIFNSKVAKEYVDYMASLGLELNQKKSVVSVSKAAGEYLKKTWIKDTDVSMISWKQLYQNHGTLMGRCSDALYFLQKWSGAKLPIVAVVRRAALTWPALLKTDKKLLNLPLLSLLSVALRQKKIPIQNFLAFLIKEGVEISFKSLFARVSNLTPNTNEVVEVLKKFFAGESDLLPSSASFLQRTWSLQGGPLIGIHKRLVNQIMTVQFRIHGEFSFHDYNPNSSLDREWSYAQPEDDSFGGLMSEQGSPLFRSKWSNARLVELTKPFVGLTKDQQVINIACDLIEDIILVPAWNKFVQQVKEVLPEYTTANYQFDRERMKDLTVSELIVLLDALIGLETTLTIAAIEDEDRRKPHSVNLRVLSTLKPGADGSPVEDKVHSFYKRMIFVFDEGPAGW